ncbi:MAG: hypothetical protein JWO58_229 [Chitinophagaceae bacterium]|nr:hypothetical protein [Chitinophagaceae bacterium]
MELIFKHTWILFIVVTFANGFLLKYHSKKYIDKNSALQTGYENYFQGIIFYGNIPWIIMAIGDLTGLTHNTFDYFHPKAMNPMVLVFHATVILLWILSIRWIYFKDGAHFIEQHPGLFRKNTWSGSSDDITAKQIKLFFPLALLGGMLGMIMMWFGNFPHSPF